MLPNQKLPISAEKKKLAFRWLGLNSLMKDIFFNGNRLEAGSEPGSRPNEECPVRAQSTRKGKLLKIRNDLFFKVNCYTLKLNILEMKFISQIST